MITDYVGPTRVFIRGSGRSESGDVLFRKKL